jgi:HEXXH motif-containing protein
MAMAQSLRYSLRQRGVPQPCTGQPMRAQTTLAVDGPLEPLVFGAYFDLVAPPTGTAPFSDVARQTANEAVVWLQSRFSSSTISEGVRQILQVGAPPLVTTLGPEHYSPVEVSRWQRWLDMEPRNAMQLTGLQAPALRVEADKIGQALHMLQRCAPALYAELLIITREIVVAAPSGKQLLDFRGASSFAMWGAIAVNQQAHSHWWQYVTTLVHESAHSLLFAYARTQPLVLNDMDQRYTSPLRQEPRPMDGIFHAAFVSAREAYALDQCIAALEREKVESALCQTLENELGNSVCAFWDCCEQLEQHGRLSPLGHSILDESKHYMREHFSVSASH